MKFSWHNLPRPFTALAPLDGVTDVVFRQVIAEIGKPDVMFTEFTMTDGLVSKGREKSLERLRFSPNEHPIIAQIWGTKPGNFYKTAVELVEMGFDGIDINMGCPDRTVIKGGACSALIKNPSLAGEIIQAVKEGAGDLPVSVKTRIGFDREQKSEWLGFLLEQGIDALTVHLRTVREQSKVPAHWELMSEITAMRDKIAPATILIGNGDILTLEEIGKKFGLYGCDGYMVGRGIFANPWMFNPAVNFEDITVEKKIALYIYHIELFKKTWGDEKNFANLKKFAKTYISNFPGSSELRAQLMDTKKIDELIDVLKSYKTE
ncbi:MAG: tRNA-dihydrouridine synthase [Candidatus Levybacteria bacterium]|nr:tRNA-dihydrouridine synthase [Candidatus Levybacteria bacterium]